jgi:hypothetical protein
MLLVPLLVVALALSVVGPAMAVDYPIDAKRLVVKKNALGARSLKFVGVDSANAVPATVSPDNPAFGTPGGVVVDLFSGGEGQGSFSIPVGLGDPGWSAKPTPEYRFKNVNAPVGPSLAKLAFLRWGAAIKLVTNDVPLPLDVPHGTLGIRITMGSVRLCALFYGAAVKKDVPWHFVGRKVSAGVIPDCEDATLEGATVCNSGDTFQEIQQRIFDARGCNVGTCHGPFPAADLDLRPGASYVELIDVLANNATAAAAGKKRVVSGNPAASFLSQKLHGTMGVGEGGQMPVVGGPLTTTELLLIDAWIAAGAPQVGHVAGAPCLPPETYEPAPPLSPPPGGYQIVLNGPTLNPGQEQEGCMWIPVPNATDFDVSKWEFSLNPGTHHFAIFEWNRAGTPVTNVWSPGDFGCFSGAQFGNNVSGSPQAPYYVDAYPAGVARRLVAGRYLGLNAHYYNNFSVPLQIKVTINLYPYSGPAPRLATTIVDIDDTFGINIAPFTESVFPPTGAPRARWTNTSAVPRNVIYLGGHMHNRGERFTVWSSGGTKLYESFDWAHPNSRFFTTPLVLAPGDYVDYECFYDNGVDRPVRTNSFGDPVNLVFGVSAEDAMCIVTGTYYE